MFINSRMNEIKGGNSQHMRVYSLQLPATRMTLTRQHWIDDIKHRSTCCMSLSAERAEPGQVCLLYHFLQLRVFHSPLKKVTAYFLWVSIDTDVLNSPTLHPTIGVNSYENPMNAFRTKGGGEEEEGGANAAASVSASLTFPLHRCVPLHLWKKQIPADFLTIPNPASSCSPDRTGMSPWPLLHCPPSPLHSCHPPDNPCPPNSP